MTRSFVYKVSRSLASLIVAAAITAGLTTANGYAMPPVSSIGTTTAPAGFVTKAELSKSVFAVKELTTLTAPNATIELLEPGDYALLPNGDGAYVHYVYTGKARITFDSLPLESSLDLFHETGVVKPGEPISLEIAGFYAKCGATAGMSAFGEGIPMLVDPANPPAFLDALWQTYVQAWSDAFPYEPTEEEMAAMMGGGMPKPASLVRNPNPDEFFLALITTDGKRFDYTVGGDGTVRITSYFGGLNWYEHPYAVIEEDFDPRFDFLSKDVVYTFDPATQATSLNILCTATSAANLSSYTVFCYPWLEVKYVEVDGISVPFKRGEFKDAPTWAVEIQSSFQKNRQYQLYFEFVGTAPESYDGIGYGGVYRFDDYALYTAADACDKSIYVEMPEGTNWKFIESSGGTTAVIDPYTRSASWSNSSRGVTLVSTQFPMREFESYGVTLDVYAPAELIDGIGENPAVAQLGQMLNYFSDAFGVFSSVYPGGKITRQPLFIIPDEGGVAAFENAGLLFYLGNDHNLPLVAHEVSHIWWGQMVDGPTWFVEGLANYCPIAYFEQYEPSQAESYRRYIVQAAVASGKPIGVERLEELGDTGALYQHAAAMFVSMAHIYGKDAFIGALKELNRANFDGPALDADAIFDGLGKEMNVDLTNFRKLFFDTTKAPTVTAELRYRDFKPVMVVKRSDDTNQNIPVDVAIRFNGMEESQRFTVISHGLASDSGSLTGGGRDDYIDLPEIASPIPSAELNDYIRDFVIDPDNRLLIDTPERDKYQTFLGWLIPAWTKRGGGDTEGAIYCFEQALTLRSWARDYNDLASLYFQMGRIDEARAMVTEMLAAADAGGVFHDHEIEPKTLCQIHWLAGKIAERDGKADEAKAHFEKVIELGNATGLYNLVKSAEEKLGIAHVEAEAGTGSMPAGMG